MRTARCPTTAAPLRAVTREGSGGSVAVSVPVKEQGWLCIFGEVVESQFLDVLRLWVHLNSLGERRLLSNQFSSLLTVCTDRPSLHAVFAATNRTEAPSSQVASGSTAAPLPTLKTTWSSSVLDLSIVHVHGCSPAPLPCLMNLISFYDRRPCGEQQCKQLTAT